MLAVQIDDRFMGHCTSFQSCISVPLDGLAVRIVRDLLPDAKARSRVDREGLNGGAGERS
jgi:hypothetical protein